MTSTAPRHDDGPDKPFVEALARAGQKAYAKRLRELEAGKATAPPYDPLAALERREEARAKRHMGSVVRRLHRQGKLGDRQLDALETWAVDHAAATAGVRSNLGRDGAAGGEGPGDADPGRGRALALSRYLVARVALHVGAGPAAGAVTEAVACRNASLAAAAAAAGRSNGRATCEAGELLKAGADALDLHYRGRGAR